MVGRCCEIYCLDLMGTSPAQFHGDLKLVLTNKQLKLKCWGHPHNSFTGGELFSKPRDFGILH